jgi:hypothetical protein
VISDLYLNVDQREEFNAFGQAVAGAEQNLED